LDSADRRRERFEHVYPPDLQVRILRSWTTGCGLAVNQQVARMGWRTKVAFVILTLVNLALVLFGAWLALWTPMLFDSGSTQDKGLVAAAVSIMLFPVLALICALLPWLFLWLRWRRTAVVIAMLPILIAAGAALFVFA
jgi:hypothetical protein